MFSLTSTFSAVSFQEEPFDGFLTWFLIFLFLDLVDNKEEKRRKEKERRLRIAAQNEASRIKKRRQRYALKMPP